MFLPDFAPAVDGKAEWRFWRSKNRTILTDTVFFAVKKGFPPTPESKKN
jgi:hypothetical protein